MTGTGGLTMKRGIWLTLALLAASVLLAGCGEAAESAPVSPSRLVPVPGTSRQQVVLTPQAIKRIGLQTAVVQQAPGGGEAVPLSSVLYLSDGSTWVYAVVGPRTYVREGVTVARAAGTTAMLQKGPAPGTTVVTTGAAELLGSEYGVAGGQ